MNVSFDGRFFERGSDDYERARVDAIFNARRPGRFPAAVLEAASEADVVAGVRLANERGWKITIRSGGHSWAAWSLEDDSLLIDLAGLHELRLIDRTTAVAAPSTRGGDELNPFLRSHGLMFPGGHCPSVGIGGFLSQGGQGWNGRPWGWGCENVLAVDVVTAAGELVHASPDSHADLYWAARGAGPGMFGIITRFYLRVHELPPYFAQTVYALPIEAFDDVIAWAHAVLPTLDIRVEPVIVGTRLPPPGVDVGGGPLIVIATTGMFDSKEDAEQCMAPLQTCPWLDRALLADFAAEATWEVVNEIQTMQNPADHRYAVDCAWTDASAEELIPLLKPVYTDLPTSESFAIWYGWNPTRPLQDMAFSMEANVYVAAYAVWNDPHDDQRVMNWVTSRLRALEPITVGVYLGDADLLRRPGKFMADANFAKLERIRGEYDPAGLFPNYRVKPGTTINEFESG
jgi:FAD/FMN-containing dehydrogenase